MFNVLLQPSEQPQTYKFSKEDVDLTSKFKLQNLDDSYDPKELVPDSVAQKVANAYNYITGDKKLGEHYLEQSILGKKILGIISKDYNLIFEFVRQIEKSVNLRSDDWGDKLQGYLSEIKDAKAHEEKKALAGKCLERVRRYPPPKDMLAAWKNE